ncbi:hypothetical protein BD410DRAFT_608876 [Rickenella mellea]|uniref:Uncharacterized protein n=1 Tax=Rickenella mellea TaxID=50990 RepID=A0A4Y7QF34_9AGAM|nr:hypothetical protein BD410DRAFT_608876 [Rickenella mellea]
MFRMFLFKTLSKGVNHLRPPLQITAEDIKPDIEEIGAMQKAIKEMQVCKELFDGWGEQLDQSRSQHMGDLESDIRSAVSNLRDDADNALRACDDIVKSQQTLSRIMTRRLDHAAEHNSGVLRTSPEVELLSDTICSHSAELSTYVGTMIEKLNGLVNVIENAKVEVEKKTVWQRICGWLKKVCDFMGSVFFNAANLCFRIGGRYGFTAGSMFVTSSALALEASAVCDRFARGNLKDDDKFDEVLRFLKTTVPFEATKARESLVAFQAHQRLVQVEAKMKNGRRVKLNKGEVREAQENWDVQNGMMQLVQVR